MKKILALVASTFLLAGFQQAAIAETNGQVWLKKKDAETDRKANEKRANNSGTAGSAWKSDKDADKQAAKEKAQNRETLSKLGPAKDRPYKPPAATSPKPTPEKKSTTTSTSSSKKPQRIRE